MISPNRTNLKADDNPFAQKRNDPDGDWNRLVSVII